jgi:erythromycin esterase-like protein
MREPDNPPMLIDVMRKAVHPLAGASEDYDPLLALIGESRFVLLGEASHGTYQFYRARAEITKRLITEKGFHAVAIEADWPNAYRVNCFVRGVGDDATANDALADFKRFPTWMWRNRDVLEFITWLHDYNDSLPHNGAKVGFFGLDLYSLHSSMEAVIDYLDKHDPEAAARARYRYSCFDHFGENPQDYGYAATFGVTQSCENEVVEQLVELQRRALDFVRRDGRVAEDEFFYAEQNARLAKNAEQYYRSMFHGRVSSWNLRDRPMVETLNALAAHLSKAPRPAKVVVWAHNSHLGDARATDMGKAGEWNVGQLVREQYRFDAALIGFTTYEGTVTAASDWGEVAERKIVRPAFSGSYEALFHMAQIPRFMMVLRADNAAVAGLRQPHLERAIGVIYRPETERISHYFYAQLPNQFDAVLHFDQTDAVEPLERSSHWEVGELPETFPTGV